MLPRSNGLLWGTAFLAVHAAVLGLVPEKRTELSYVFSLAATVLALTACVRRYFTASRKMRLYWGLFCSAIVLWGCGMARAGWEEIFLRTDVSLANYADLIYFFYGVPIILAISLPTKQVRVPLFFWLDVLQVTAAAILTYLNFFTTLPFIGRPIQPMPANVLSAIYAMENIFLAMAAGLRLYSVTEGETRSFYRVLTVFLWTYALFAIVYNQMSLWRNGSMGYFALLSDVPFLLLAVVALSPPSDKPPSVSWASRPLAQFIDHISPVLFTLVLIVLGLSVADQHFSIGAGAILIAAIAYAVRTTVLQMRYVQSQQKLQEASEQLEALSLTDALTGLANRRSFDRSLHQEWNRAIRTQSSLGLLMIDVDFFKKLNDHYGHAQGDECLRTVGKALQQSLQRSTDIAARYGGEEFVILLPSTDAASAYAIAQRIHENIAALNIPHALAALGQVTVSIGIGLVTPQKTEVSGTLLRMADQALYRAKEAGRNRIEGVPYES